MFCGDGDPAQSASIRPLSIKGLLRFHFRAVAWRLLKGDLQKIRKYENDLFGSTDRGTGILRMIVEILDAGEPCPTPLRSANGQVVGDGVRYLGYGLMEAFGQNAGVLTRKAIAGAKFCLHLTINSQDVKDKSFMHFTLLSIALSGCLGARSRKGFGSLHLTELVIDQKIEDLTVWPKWVPLLKKGFEGESEYPSYTAWSNQSSVVQIAKADTALGVLDIIGKSMMLYRSYGRNGKVLGKDSLKLFEEDHDLMLKAHDSGVQGIPSRSAFGLPHKYYFSSIGNPNIGAQPERHERRASPILIKVLPQGTGFIGLLNFLPAVFLPNDERITIKNGRQIKSSKGVGNLREFYLPVTGFLGFLKENRCTFTNGMEVTKL